LKVSVIYINPRESSGCPIRIFAKFRSSRAQAEGVILGQVDRYILLGDITYDQ